MTPLTEKIEKPLGMKAYGHIMHLPGSRRGPGDHSCSEGQARICTERPRDQDDLITVTEKLDGSNVAVARIDGIIVPLIRAGYPAVASPREQHRLFQLWAMGRNALFLDILRDGERLCGEWLAQAHGTRYRLIHEPFVAFDLMAGHKRFTESELWARVCSELPVPRRLHLGCFSIAAALEALKTSGHGALDPVEGAVWRVERKGVFDFMAKYVRPEKVDGSYLPETSGAEPVWNWRPGATA